MPRRLTLPRRAAKAPPIIACGCGRCIPVTEAVAVSLYPGDTPEWICQECEDNLERKRRK